MSRRSTDLRLADGEVKQGNDLDVLRFSKLGLNPGPSSGSTHQESSLSLQSSQELALGGHSLFDTEGGVVSWGLMMQSPSLPSQPLMPFAEWSIEFSELRIGIRVGIGKIFLFILSSEVSLCQSSERLPWFWWTDLWVCGASALSSISYEELDKSWIGCCESFVGFL